jgi:ATP-dependent helicase/DNAse subunit B
MPLTLVLGPANSAKAGETLGAYAAAAPGGALLVVPTAADARHYARELAEQGTVLGSVLTFRGLAGEIARRAGYLARPISNLARERLLLGVLRSVNFEVLAASAQSPGFLTASAELIAELERSLVRPQRFAEALNRWGAEDPGRKPYAREVGAIYLAYVHELDRRGHVDRELYAWRALDALRATPARWGTDRVFFYGFDDLHPLERDAVETLAQAVGVEVMLSLTYEAGHPALAARAEAVEELRPLAERVVELPALDDHYAPRARRALHHLERWLFSPAPERVDPGEAVRLLEAGGERAEAELVGAEVLAHLRSGVPGEQIAVVCRSLASSAAALESVFAQYGIPSAMDRSVALGDTALGRALLALARCALLEERASAQDLLQYLRAPGVLERIEVADWLESQIRREGLRSAKQAIQRLGFCPGAIEAIRDSSDPAGELGLAGRRLLAGSCSAAAVLLDPDEQLDARALVMTLEAFEELRELGLLPEGEELVGLLEQLEVDAGNPLRPGAVQICEPLAIRARRFSAVFAYGLQESEFPRLSAPEPFLSDERRRELAAASGLRLGLGEDGLGRERYLFYAAISRATDQVVLSFRSSDEEGNLALPSPFIDDVAELLVPGWSDRRRRRLLSDVVWPPAQAPTERERRHALAAQAGAGRQPALASPGQTVLSEVAMGHVRHRELVSGGALEAYAACPVRWLVERELAPARFDPQPDPLLRGTYIHRVLEEVIGRLGRAVSPETLPDAERILQEVMAEIPPEIASGRSASVRAAAAASIEADLRRYLRHEAADGCDWEPQGLELRFGFDEEGSLPALVLGEPDAPVRVRGMIDRVDVDPAGSGRAIVRDYKSGSTRAEWQGARWRQDRQLQVGLYMLAVRRLMGLDPVAGLYQPLGGGELRPRGIFLKEAALQGRLVATDGREAAEFQDELEDAEARAVELALTLRSGLVAPCPQTCSRDGCAYPGICRNEA